MAKNIFLFFVSVLLVTTGTFGLDLPFDLSFQFGFKVQVVPGQGDMSQALGLVVTPEKIYTDKATSLVITGTIANYSGVVCDGIDMHFAVTSYVGTGINRNRAYVTPNSIIPGGVATFTTHVSLDSERPHLAMYTVTARTPVMYVQEAPSAITAPATTPEYYYPVPEVLYPAQP